MKKISIQIKVGILMLSAVILLLAAGYLSYRNISSIVSSIPVDIKPELRLITIREISMDLQNAENSLRLYKVTNDTSDLKPYYKIISNIKGKVSRFRRECMNDPVMLVQTDTISKLIEDNIVIWNQLLSLNKDDKVVEYRKRLTDLLTSNSDDTRSPENGVFKRIFSRNKKSKLDESEIISDLQQIEQQEFRTKEKLMARESQLARTGSEIKEQFYDLISKMETEVSVLINEKASNARVMADKTYRWLALFSVSGTLLAILVILIIIRYVRKTYAYQVALENSKNEAENLARTKELFVANISHEIRTPVTAISGFTEQLLQDTTDEDAIRNLKIIKSSSDYLSNIINDVLDFSKLQNRKLELEKVHFSIKQIFEEVYALFERQALGNNDSLSYYISPDTPPVLLGDPYRLKQIMINLVGNSVKFTTGGKVNFTVQCITNNSSGIELIMEFIDTGIGIEESKLDFVFEDFAQEEMSTERKYGGTGLGLSIVKNLVELHDGTIECISKKNQGTKIICRLPYLKGDVNLLKTDRLSLPSIPEEIRDLNILIVDDVEYNRLLFKKILERWNIKYEEAVNGSEALEKIKNNRYGLVFMDARMPGIDGLKAVQIIRQELNLSASELPVVCVSATNISEDNYRKAGINMFLQKPFTEEMLLTTIISVIRESVPLGIDKVISAEPVRSSGSGKINLSNLHHISGGDEQFAREMIISFIETTGDGLKEMDKAVISDDRESVSNLAHKMLPPSRHIGASGLSRILTEIEDSLRNKSDMGVVRTLTKESLKEFEIVCEQLQEEIVKRSNSFR